MRNMRDLVRRFWAAILAAVEDENRRMDLYYNGA